MDLTAADIVVSGESDSAPGSVVKFGRDKIKMDPDYQYVFFILTKIPTKIMMALCNRFETWGDNRNVKNCDCSNYVQSLFRTLVFVAY